MLLRDVASVSLIMLTAAIDVQIPFTAVQKVQTNGIKLYESRRLNGDYMFSNSSHLTRELEDEASAWPAIFHRLSILRHYLTFRTLPWPLFKKAYQICQTAITSFTKLHNGTVNMTPAWHPTCDSFRCYLGIWRAELHRRHDIANMIV